MILFEDLLREINRLEKEIEVSFPIEADEEGYVDKECPSESCLFQFKVLKEDWENLFSADRVFCPMCRHEAPIQHWFTTEQIESAKEQSIDYFGDVVTEALHRGAKTFNNKPQKGFIRFSLEVNGSRGIRELVPIPSGETFDLKIKCSKCSANYAVIGSGFFCPCCGYNSASRTFDESLIKIEVKLSSVALIRKQYQLEGKRDDGEILARSIIETALSDCVVAIQRLSEQLYSSVSGNEPVPQNLFQRVDDSNRKWKAVIGAGYDDWLTGGEMAILRILFQRRHLLAHCEGIVDQKYLERSGDHTYNVGQRIVVKEEDVRVLKELISRIANGIRDECKAGGYSV